MYHLKLVGRQIFQRKGYFVINTIGLAVALTASVLIYTFLVKEWQTNTYHKNVDHIYRITVQTDGYAYTAESQIRPTPEDRGILPSGMPGSFRCRLRAMPASQARPVSSDTAR